MFDQKPSRWARFALPILKTLPIHQTLLSLSLASMLAACTVGPDYHPPRSAVPEQWSEPLPDTSSRPTDLSYWWHGFHDAKLNRLVELALKDNPDLRMTHTRIEAARAQQSATDAERWPSVNASSAFQRQRISPNALLGALGSIQGGSQGSRSAGLLSTLGPIGSPFNLFQAGFDTAWELDLFGGIRRKQEAAAANAEAIEESRRDVQVSLAAEVTRLYLELIALRQQHRVAEDRLTDALTLERLATASFTEGLVTAMDLEQAKTLAQTTAASLAPLKARISNTHHALALLTGKTPQGLDGELAQLPETIPEPPSIRPGLPADLLRRRPDIRQAERTVASASASIGAAVAELFPKISLTGAAGFQSQDLSNFTHLSSGFYGFGPRVSIPVFQAGRLLANIDAQKARHGEALLGYEKTVLTALREVEDSLSSAQGELARRQDLEQAEQAAQKAADAATAYYREGETDLDKVVRARNDWHEAKDRLIQSRLAWSASHIGLFKALGGGW